VSLDLPLHLPVLKLDHNVPQTCDGSRCATCPLHGNLCRGCGSDPKENCGSQHSCQTGCNNCHGEEDAGRLITGVCCKSPLAPFALRQISSLPGLKYTKQPQLKDLPDERIPTLLDRHHNTHAPVNAVSMHRVYSKKGWKSADIKDYLKLPKSSKLVLNTVMRDDYLDNFMDLRWFDTVQQVGFDWWSPLLFSMFMDESQMQKLHSMWRIMRNLQDCQGHFVPFLGFYPRLSLEEELHRAVKAVPNVFINASHGSEQQDAQMRIYGYVKKYAKLFGPGVTWFVQGMTARYKRQAFRSLLPAGTPCYFFITPLTGARRTDDQYGWYTQK
jgi:hypothetical protein